MVVEKITDLEDAKSYVTTCVDMSGEHGACLDVEDVLGVTAGSVSIDEDGLIYVDGVAISDEKLIEVANKI